MYTKNFLLALRRRTLRRGLWYGTLDNLDRGIYNLTCAVVDRVKSATLLRQILSIVRARAWRGDEGFARFFAVMAFYAPSRARITEPFVKKWGFPIWILYLIGFGIFMIIIFILMVKYS